MKTILIAGAGFSGTLTAVQLLRQCGTQKINLLLVERSDEFASGLAYGRAAADHMLNVPAGNMSALPDQPDHFLHFCQRLDPAHGASSFLPRRLYAGYLADLLQQQEQARPGLLQRIHAEVVALTPAPGGWQVTLDQGQTLRVDQVVLASGNALPAHPHMAGNPAAADFYHSNRYVQDPWSAPALQAPDSDLPILLLGSGLSTVDLACSLRQQLPNRLLALSRHGLLPQPHRPSRSAGLLRAMPRLAGSDSLRQKLTRLRQHLRQGLALGEDWRDVMAALRNETPALWQELGLREQRQFIRHVRPYWDAHRHRVAPVPWQHFMAAVTDGHLQLLAGRIVDYRESANGVTVHYRPRGLQAIRQIKVARVINCTGPATRLADSDSPLLRQLLDTGRICSDPLHLGMATNAAFATMDIHGKPTPNLYYIGPGLRARFWEATAVPELRQFARQLAAILLA